MKQMPGPASQTCVELCISVGKQLYKFFEQRLDGLGLTPVQLQVLAGLGNGSALTMTALGEQLCCVGSNVTAVIGRMTQAGLVKREPDRRDGRSRLVRITRLGRKLLAGATETPRCCPQAAQWLTAREWSMLFRLLGKLRARLDAQVLAAERQQ